MSTATEVGKVHIRKIEANDFFSIANNLQKDQVLDLALLHEIDVESVLKDMFDGYSVISPIGEVMACMGLTELPSGKHDLMGWAFFVNGLGTQFAEIHKCVLAWLNYYDYKNIYITVKDEFSEGHRWAEMLGFVAIGVIPEYYPEEVDGVLYRRERM